ncbi:hypothetical protein CDAR_600441 [Caerostris darwini]|uniref:Uncharacterized protein n=1 Tax=Caerostris darwini TaxID=1538125 RepID=A0AAV4TW16_9ARAC|nr:hypothetical protein CDAR_600441 [Caerostris darwini]
MVNTTSVFQHCLPYDDELKQTDRYSFISPQPPPKALVSEPHFYLSRLRQVTTYFAHGLVALINNHLSRNSAPIFCAFNASQNPYRVDHCGVYGIAADRDNKPPIALLLALHQVRITHNPSLE